MESEKLKARSKMKATEPTKYYLVLCVLKEVNGVKCHEGQGLLPVFESEIDAREFAGDRFQVIEATSLEEEDL